VHVPDHVKPSFVIFDIWALRRSGLSIRMSGCQIDRKIEVVELSIVSHPFHMGIVSGADLFCYSSTALQQRPT